MSQIAIVGAGPAGSVAALLLAQHGHAVTLIERANFPRVKVCGEFISPAVTPLLESLLPVSELLHAGARRVDRIVIELGVRERSWVMPSPAWTISRGALDALLSAKARDAGAVILQPAGVRSVEYRADRVGISLVDGRAIEAEVILHADGSGRHDPAGPTPSDPGLVGHKCHLRPHRPIEGVRMRVGRGSYLGTIQVEDGLATCALVAEKRLIARHNGDTDALARELWPGFEAGTRVGGWRSCGVARSRYITPGHPRSFRLGNAAAAVDPVGGEGIGLALWSAAELARLIGSAAPVGAQAWLDPSRLPLLHQEFARIYAARLRTRLPACRLAAKVCTMPRFFRVLWPILAMPSLSIGPWYRWTGKQG